MGRTIALVAPLIVVLAGTMAAQPVGLASPDPGPLAAWTPPLPCEGVFSDVPCSWSSAVWIEQLARDGVTAGCGSGATYCPG